MLILSKKNKTKQKDYVKSIFMFTRMMTQNFCLSHEWCVCVMIQWRWPKKFLFFLMKFGKKQSKHSSWMSYKDNKIVEHKKKAPIFHTIQFFFRRVGGWWCQTLNDETETSSTSMMTEKSKKKNFDEIFAFNLLWICIDQIQSSFFLLLID